MKLEGNGNRTRQKRHLTCGTHSDTHVLFMFQKGCGMSFFPKHDHAMTFDLTGVIPQRQGRAFRIAMNLRVNSDTDCWEWTGATSPAGYGRVKIDRKVVLPHRVMAWAFGIVKTISDPARTAVVMHSCDNPACCNPAHLSAGTMSENMLDASRKGRIGKKR